MHMFTLSESVCNLFTQMSLIWLSYKKNREVREAENTRQKLFQIVSDIPHKTLRRREHWNNET